MKIIFLLGDKPTRLKYQPIPHPVQNRSRFLRRSEGPAWASGLSSEHRERISREPSTKLMEWRRRRCPSVTRALSSKSSRIEKTHSLIGWKKGVRSGLRISMKRTCQWLLTISLISSRSCLRNGRRRKSRLPLYRAWKVSIEWLYHFPKCCESIWKMRRSPRLRSATAARTALSQGKM